MVKVRYNAKFNEIQLLKLLRQMRYGQLHVDLSTFKNENIKDAAQKLLEALQDREKMLAEYKQILMEKNKSLEDMIELEKESQKFKDDFVAALTHDLKTPVIAELNAIKMMLAGNFGQISTQQRDVLEMMLKSDKELIELSEMLLQTYKFQQKEIKLNKTKVKISDFISSFFEESKPLFNPKNQHPSLIISDNNITAEIDTFHFKRVLYNLISNAVKYSYDNTEIVIELLSVDGNFVVKITNEGEIINPEDVKLIFDKYYSGIKKFSQLGTGLGLYCANKIVTAHNGSISVCSNGGKTVFTVSLPSINV